MEIKIRIPVVRDPQGIEVGFCEFMNFQRVSWEVPGIWGPKHAGLRS